MKFGYLSKNSHQLEKLRNRYIMQKFNYKILHNISLRKICILQPTFFYIDDHISIAEVVKLLICFKLNLIKRFVIRCSELYTIDYHAYDTEVNKHLTDFNKINILKKIWAKRVYLKIYLFKKIINNKNTILILPSLLRKKYYIENIKTHNKIIVLRNLPMIDELNFKQVDFFKIFDSTIAEIINSENYFLLAGNINSLKDLNILGNYSKKMNIPIIIASNDIVNVKKLQKIFPENIVYIGVVEHNLILNLVYKCNSGIILYNNDTINQKYSASSKLFEFLYFSKPVIVSDNDGVKNELILESYSHKIILENTLMENNFDFKIDNNRFVFENEIASLEKTLQNYI
jgi:hypothetical protein